MFGCRDCSVSSARRTGRAALPHPAHRRRSPPAFGFPRHGRFGRGAMTSPDRLTRPSWSAETTPTTQRPKAGRRPWRLATKRARRICAYHLMSTKCWVEFPVTEEPSPASQKPVEAPHDFFDRQQYPTSTRSRTVPVLWPGARQARARTPPSKVGRWRRRGGR